MDGFDFDVLEDLIETDILYAIFEDDDKFVKKQITYQLNKQKKDKNNF